MTHPRPWQAAPLAVGALLLAATGVLAAQSATTPRTTSTVQPPVRPAPPRQSAAPTIPPASPMPTRPGQRRQAAPIAAPHPPTQSRDSAAGHAATRERPRVPATSAPKVYDRRGRALNNMRQAGPNRVLDTSTGRYYDTTPSGDGQRIVDPSPRRDD